MAAHRVTFGSSPGSRSTHDAGRHAGVVVAATLLTKRPHKNKAGLARGKRKSKLLPLITLRHIYSPFPHSPLLASILTPWLVPLLPMEKNDVVKPFL